MDEKALKEQAIDWNWNQFFRAVDQNRIRDAKRYRQNIRNLERTQV